MLEEGASRRVSLLPTREGASRTLSDEVLGAVTRELLGATELELRGDGETTVPELRLVALELGVEIRGTE